MKRIFKISILTVSLVIFVFLVIVFRLYRVRYNDLSLQKNHIESLDAFYDASYESVDETALLNFDMFDDQLKLDDIQMIASHNSYKKNGPAIGRFFVGLGSSFEEARALKYEYKNITEQLHLGIRSFEFDMRYRKDQFELTHVPLVDASSQAVSFDLLLDEIVMFSLHQENHMPMIILIEIKEDWMMLDPSLQDIKKEELALLDSLIEEKLKDRLFKPSNLISSEEILRDKITNDGWPMISELLNKIIFVLHPGSFESTYYEMDETLQSQSMFIGSTYQEIYPKYASFFVQNDVDLTKINELVENHFMVRTRIDSELIFDINRYEQAIESGAQILTTDFSIGRNDLIIEDVIYLENQKMMIKKET